MIEHRCGPGRGLLVAALLALSVPMGIAAQSTLGGSEGASPVTTTSRPNVVDRDALDDVEWANAKVLTRFTQTQPVDRALMGDFDLGRDAGALFDATADNRFIIKINYWSGL